MNLSLRLRDPARPILPDFVITAAVLVAPQEPRLVEGAPCAREPVPPLKKEYASRENLAALDARSTNCADFERAPRTVRTSAASREKIYESIRALERGVAAVQKRPIA